MIKNQNNTSFLKYFAVIFFGLFIFICLLNFIINPKRILPEIISINYVSDRNPVAKKRSYLLNRSDIKLLILGSSRAEGFSPREFKKHTGLESFNAATGGASADVKYDLLVHALQNNKLTRVIIVSDFFEFNRQQYQTTVKTRPTSIKLSSPSLTHIISELISRKTTQGSLRTIMDIYRKTPSVFQYDGTTLQSMVEDDPTNLNVRINKSFYLEYNPIFRSYKYNENILNFYKLMKDLSIKNNFTLHILMSTEHPKFQELTAQHYPKLHQEVSRWKDAITSLADSQHVLTYDLESVMNTIPEYQSARVEQSDLRKYWHDGVHPSSYTQKIIIPYLEL